MIYSILKPFLQLCLLNRGPQDLPASTLLMAFALTAYAAISALIAWPFYGGQVSLLQTGLELLLLTAYTRLAVQLARHPGRFTQTLTALAGTGFLLGILLLPLVYGMYRARAGAGDPGLAALGYLMVLVWLLVVFGHIFRQALSLKHIGLGILVALGFILLSSLVSEALFPVETP